MTLQKFIYFFQPILTVFPKECPSIFLADLPGRRGQHGLLLRVNGWSILGLRALLAEILQRWEADGPDPDVWYSITTIRIIRRISKMLNARAETEHHITSIFIIILRAYWESLYCWWAIHRGTTWGVWDRLSLSFSVKADSNRQSSAQLWPVIPSFSTLVLPKL